MGVMTLNSGAAEKMLITLGLENVKAIRSFRMNFTANQVAEIHVSFFPSPEQVEEINEHFKRYTLIEIEDK